MKLLLIPLMLCSCVLAQESRTIARGVMIGRFQIYSLEATISDDAGKTFRPHRLVFRLDTDTGQTWKYVTGIFGGVTINAWVVVSEADLGTVPPNPDIPPVQARDQSSFNIEDELRENAAKSQPKALPKPVEGAAGPWVKYGGTAPAAPVAVEGMHRKSPTPK